MRSSYVIVFLTLAACQPHFRSSNQSSHEAKDAETALAESQIDKVTLEQNELKVLNKAGGLILTEAKVKEQKSSSRFVAISFLSGKIELRSSTNAVLFETEGRAEIQLSDTFAVVFEGSKRLLFHFQKTEPVYSTEAGGSVQVSNKFAAIQEPGKPGRVLKADLETFIELKAPARMWVSDSFVAYLTESEGALLNASGEEISQTTQGQSYALTNQYALEITNSSEALVYNLDGDLLRKIKDGKGYHLKEDQLIYTDKKGATQVVNLIEAPLSS